MRARVASLACAVVAALVPAAPALADHSDAHRAAQQAERLDDAARAKAGQLDAARDALTDLAARANHALERYQRASDLARNAEADRRAAEASLAAATARTAAQREHVSSYATNIYRGGGSEQLTLVADLFTSENPQRLISAAGTLETVGDRQAMALEGFRAAQEEEAAARRLAANIAAGAAASAREAARSKLEAERLIELQQQKVAELRTATDRARGEARSAAERAEALRRAEVIARQQAARGPMGPVAAECTGEDVSAYPNGQLPERALCPLWGAPGHALRADAAAAFNLMSREFAEQFGTPICVTDSYRTYDEQVTLKAAKPGLAAAPGTSNHGWGLATDLCGGIQNDNTAPNDWLRANAGRFSWFHPSWADPGGSGPYEPWHWEYAGP